MPAKEKIMKPTKAMIEWCRFIKNGGHIEKRNCVGYFCCGRGGFTYIMGNKLEESGLVCFDSKQAVLTAAGKMCVA
jgi:hypothetical protein